MVHVSFKVKDKYLGKHRQRPANIVICRRHLPFVPAKELGNDRILSLSVTHDVCWYLPICPSLPSWLLDLKYLPCQHHPLYHARFALMNVVKCHLKYASMRFVRAVVFRWQRRSIIELTENSDNWQPQRSYRCHTFNNPCLPHVIRFIAAS